MIEADVATHISRGDTLILMTDRLDNNLSARAQSAVGQLRAEWALLKQLSDRKKATAKSYEEKVEKFRADVNELKTWLGHSLRQMTWAQVIY